MWKKATVKERSIWKKTSISGPICGNVLWILPGAIIDIATGGAWEVRHINLRLNASE
jgi:hypothetical protein